MATSSFNKTFVVNSRKDARIICNALESAPKNLSPKRDVEKSLKKGAQLLSRKLSASAK